MANSIITATGDGTTTQYALNFTLGILSRDYVTCRVGSEVDGLGDPVYRTLEWITDGLVNIQGAVPGNGVPITFSRTVPKDQLIHDYTDGVPITEENLDESNLQTLMAVHEFLDGRLEGGFVQDLSMNGFKITDLGDGTDPEDAVNLSQLEDMTGNAPVYAAAAAASAQDAQDAQTATEAVLVSAEAVLDTTEDARDAALAAQVAAESASAGMEWRPSVRAATTANIILSGAQTIDGVSVVATDRVLVKNQSTASQNGVYVAAAGAWTRATDADSWTELVSQVVAVEEGATQADYIFICTVNQGGTLGSTSVTWSDIKIPLPDGAVSTAAKITDGIITYIKLASTAIGAIADVVAATASKLVTAALLREYVSPWVAYTPTFTGFGTPTGVEFYSRRVGDVLEVNGKFTTGTTTAVEARVTLGYNGSDGNVTTEGASKNPSGTSISGDAVAAVTNAAFFGLTALKERSVNYMTFGRQTDTTHALTKIVGANVGNTTVVAVNAKFPIAGW